METEYNAAGQLTNYTYPDGTPVTRGYSPRGELATIGYDGTTVDTRTYDDGGRMLTSSYNNGVSETRAYNHDNTLASISFSGAPIGDLSYTWDTNKNKTSESITGVMSGYGFSIPTNGYDAEDRLVGYQRNDNNLNQSWNLSLVGDWNSVTTNAATQSRTHGPTHEILTAGSDSITHDAKGNITAKPSNLDPAFTSTLQWDFDNRLMSMDVNEDSTADATFKYDALGRRVQKNSTVYALTGQQVIAEYSAGTAASSPTEQYVFASYIDEPVLKDGTGGLVYYHRNQQYSILALTNSSGGIAERYSYDAYGKLAVKDGSGTALASSSVGNSITYTGRNFDAETGDYYYRARYYDSGLGRFCSKDPTKYDGSEWNLYEYVASGPLKRIDPYGLVGELPPGVSPASNGFIFPGTPRGGTKGESSCSKALGGMLTVIKKPGLGGPPSGSPQMHECLYAIVDAHEAEHRRNMAPCCSGYLNCIAAAGEDEVLLGKCSDSWRDWQDENGIAFEKRGASVSCETAQQFLKMPKCPG